MIVAISSQKPFTKAAPEIVENQIRAFKSWEKVFNGIVYFGHPVAGLNGPKTTYVHTKNAPTIKSLAEKAAEFAGWACLINADIVVTPGILSVWRQLCKTNAVCALSKRFDLVTGQQLPNDNGLDIFLATKSVWRAVSREVPEQFKIGSILWDTWMASFFATNYSDRCYDFTPSRVVFHPKHENRGDQSLLDKPSDKYLTETRYPAYILKI